MAKTIKFNLICDDKPVRTIEDLQNNFSIEDVLAYYNNKLLHRWLSVRGYTDELDKVLAITCEKPIDIIKELIKVFNILCDDADVEKSVYMLEYLEERKKLCAIYEKGNYETKKIISDYEAKYWQLIEGILENPDDAAIIKANIAEMMANYSWVFGLNHRELFYILGVESGLAIMCLLMNEHSRNYYLPVEIISEDGKVILDTDSNSDKKNMFQAIRGMIVTKDFQTNLGRNLNSFSGVTDGYWKDLEPKGKNYMIISMDKGDFVRSSGNNGGDLASDDVMNKFVIINGIDYKSNSANHRLLYMEV